MLISHNDIPQVSQDFMNNTHGEEVDLINALFDAILVYEKDLKNKEEVDKLYEGWVAHTVAHFTREEVEMYEAGFQAFPMHKGEHDRVLAQMNEVFDTWKEKNDIKVLKIYLIEIVPQWLISHISTMDAMTANFLGGSITAH